MAPPPRILPDRAQLLRGVKRLVRASYRVPGAGDTIRRSVRLGQLVAGHLGRHNPPWRLARLMLGDRPAARVGICTGPGEVYLEPQSFAADRAALTEIFGAAVYAADYRDASVIDVGAHKGYYSAYALAGGAARVLAFEPDPANYACIEASARAHRGEGAWSPQRAAVGSRVGTIAFFVYEDSWGHSTIERSGQPPRERIEVPLRPLAGAIDEARSDARATRLIVKIDAEGAECDIVLNTAPDAWRRVDEVFLEYHNFAPCAEQAIVEHLAQAGLTLRARTGGGDLHALMSFSRGW